MPAAWSLGLRRTRSDNSLAAAVVEVLTEFQVPVATQAVRVLLTDRGRTVTAEHLSRLAAYEREDFLRTRLPPRVCSVIDVDANLISPRWWALGDWRLQRRIRTDDAKTIWLAVLGERLCHKLSDRHGPSQQLKNLALSTVARLLPEERYFESPLSRDDWLDLRRQIVEAHPGATHSLDGASSEQSEAEAKLKAAQTPAVDLYFGRRQPR